MTETPITPGLIGRITQAARYIMGGAAPSGWFGPMQPLQPIAPLDVAGRRFDYPTGYNINYTPRSSEPVSFADLRALADNCDILRSVIETRKDQVETQEWIVRVTDSTSHRKLLPTDDQKRRIDAITSFLHCPDKERGFDQWLRQILEDMFVIDGVAIYKRRNFAGGLYALEVIDASTIKILLDDSGRLPPSPDPAYQQVLKGVPAADFTREELIYLTHNPRSHKVYGYSHVEQVLVTVNILIRRALHQLEYYREGSVPDALIGVPKEWTNEQIASFQRNFDAMLSGNLGTRRHLRFLPGDFKYQETKTPPLKDAYDEFLARIICFAFSISPEPFVGQVNRATAETSHARAIDEGLGPLMRFVRGFLNRIIACEFGSPDLEFAWVESRAQEPAEAAKIDVAYVAAGILTVDEVRLNLGLDPLVKPVVSTQKFNPNHRPPGPGGGQFISGNEAGGGLAIGAASSIVEDAEAEKEVAEDDAVQSDAEPVSLAETWALPETLKNHTERHAADFGIDPESETAMKEYATKADEFFQKFQSENLPAIEYPNGGEIGVFEPETNTFGVYNAKGQTQSFYKPTSSTYFERQIDYVNNNGGRVINQLPEAASEISPNLSQAMEPETEVDRNSVLGGSAVPELREPHGHSIVDDEEKPKL